MYLQAYIIIHQSGWVLSHWQKVGIVFALGVPITWLLAGITYIFIERPFMDMRSELKGNDRESKVALV